MAKIAKKTVLSNGIQIAFTNGTNLTANLDGLDEAIINRLAIHGLSQKLGDSYVSADNITEAVAMAEGVWDGLQAGDWTVKGGSGITLLVEALHRLTGKPIEDCVEAKRAMDDDKLKAVMKAANVKAMIATIQAERAKAKADKASESDTADLDGLFS